MNSKLFSLDSKDLWKALAMAVIASVLTTASAQLTAGVFDLNEILKVAGITFISYLSKNFLSDDQGRLGGVL